MTYCLYSYRMCEIKRLRNSPHSIKMHYRIAYLSIFGQNFLDANVISERLKDECWHLQHNCDTEVIYPYTCFDLPDLYDCSKLLHNHQISLKTPVFKALPVRNRYFRFPFHIIKDIKFINIMKMNLKISKLAQKH